MRFPAVKCITLYVDIGSMHLYLLLSKTSSCDVGSLRNQRSSYQGREKQRTSCSGLTDGSTVRTSLYGFGKNSLAVLEFP